jgi:hypothetical protein
VTSYLDVLAAGARLEPETAPADGGGERFTGRLRGRGDPAAAALLRAAIEERAALVAAVRAGTHARRGMLYGRCDVCGERQQSHCAGRCPLCRAAFQRADRAPAP